MMASDNVSSFDLEARLNRIMRNTDKTKDEALKQAYEELAQERAHEAGVVSFLREGNV